MGYLVENDHAHIDFHKGTHGYPITNADDMMKPCPLMPDGEWHVSVLRVTSTDGETSPTMTFDIYNSDAGKAYFRTNSYATDGISVVTTPSYNLLECRCGVSNSTNELATSTLGMQNNAGWQAWAQGVNQYIVLSGTYINRLKVGTTFVVWSYVASNSAVNDYCTNLLESNEMGDE